jgi:hypothetical protein
MNLAMAVTYRNTKIDIRVKKGTQMEKMLLPSDDSSVQETHSTPMPPTDHAIINSLLYKSDVEEEEK